MIGFTQSSYPAYSMPSDEDYKTLLFSNSAAKLRLISHTAKNKSEKKDGMRIDMPHST